jgi:hypothetical protein
VPTHITLTKTIKFFHWAVMPAPMGASWPMPPSPWLLEPWEGALGQYKCCGSSLADHLHDQHRLGQPQSHDFLSCGDAAPGHEMNSQEHQAGFCCQNMSRDTGLRSEGVRGGLQYEQMWKNFNNNSVKY